MKEFFLYLLKKIIFNKYYISGFLLFCVWKNVLLAVHEGYGHPALFALTFQNGRAETLLGHFDELRFCPSVRNFVRASLMHYTGGVLYFPCHRVIHDEFECANGTMTLTTFGSWLTTNEPLGLGFGRWLNLFGSFIEVMFSITIFWALALFVVPKLPKSKTKFFFKSLMYLCWFSFLWAPNHYLQRCLLHGTRCGDYGAFEMWQGNTILAVYHVVFWSHLIAFLIYRNSNRQNTYSKQVKFTYVDDLNSSKKIVQILDFLSKLSSKLENDKNGEIVRNLIENNKTNKKQVKKILKNHQLSIYEIKPCIKQI